MWQSIRPLLEPLVTPETLKLHPIRELNELCQKRSYKIILEDVSRKDGLTYYRMEVEADGIIHKYEYKGDALRDTAKKIVCKEILNSLKDGGAHKDTAKKIVCEEKLNSLKEGESNGA